MAAVAQLGGRPGVLAGGDRAPRHARGARRRSSARRPSAGCRCAPRARGTRSPRSRSPTGSWSTLGRLDRVLSVDRPPGLVKVEAGIVLGELNRRLDALGLAFENLGDIDRQTLAGSISTGTHGTGARFRSVSAQVEAVELVLADGSSLEISAASDPARLAAARIGLGALGAHLRGHDPGRARLHPRPHRQPAAARRDARAPRRAQRGQRPLRVLRLPAHADGALPREPAHRRAAAPAPPRAPSTPRR